LEIFVLVAGILVNKFCTALQFFLETFFFFPFQGVFAVMLIHTVFDTTSATDVLLLDVYLEAVTFELIGSRLHTLLSYLVISLRSCETSLSGLKRKMVALFVTVQCS
jgi:hypothetical protein